MILEFRGLTKEGKWVEGWYWPFKETVFIIPQFAYKTETHFPNGDIILQIHHLIEVIPETVGMFTGLTDKNGKKIYKSVHDNPEQGEKKK